MFQMKDHSKKHKEDRLNREEISELADIYIDYKKMFEICMYWYNKNKFWLEKKLIVNFDKYIKGIDDLSRKQETAIYNSFKNWNIDYWYYNNTILKEKTYKKSLDEYYKTYNFYNHMRQINLYNQPMIKALSQNKQKYNIIRHI